MSCDLCTNLTATQAEITGLNPKLRWPTTLSTQYRESKSEARAKVLGARNLSVSAQLTFDAQLVRNRTCVLRIEHLEPEIEQPSRIRIDSMRVAQKENDTPWYLLKSNEYYPTNDSPLLRFVNFSRDCASATNAHDEGGRLGATTLPVGARMWTGVRKRGYCGRTEVGRRNECHVGDKGTFIVAWDSSAAYPDALDQGGLQCREHCLRCARCRFYSYSLRWRDCSWFYDCDLSALHYDVLGFWTASVADSVTAGQNGSDVRFNVTRQSGHNGTRKSGDAHPLVRPSPEKAFLALLPNFTSPEVDRRPSPPPPPPMSQPPCYAPNMHGAHLEGKWKFEAGSLPPYEVHRSHWSFWQRTNAHYYGLCRDLLPAVDGDYVWQPHGCRLRSLSESADRACTSLRGRRIAVCGDSTVLQFFQSLTFVLNGSMTAWSDGGTKSRLGQSDRDDPRRIVSFACGGSVRLDFFRNGAPWISLRFGRSHTYAATKAHEPRSRTDPRTAAAKMGKVRLSIDMSSCASPHSADYLLYSRTDDRDSAKSGSFNPSRPFTDFTASTHHADVVVLGGGMHFFDNPASAALFTRVRPRRNSNARQWTARTCGGRVMTSHFD